MQNIPQNGRGLGHVTPEIFGIQSNISSKLHETSNLVCSFILGNPIGRMNNFSPKGPRPKSRDPSNFWHTIKHIFKTTSARDLEFGI